MPRRCAFDRGVKPLLRQDLTKENENDYEKEYDLRPESPRFQLQLRSFFVIGSVRMRLPVAAKIALQIAGGTTG